MAKEFGSFGILYIIIEPGKKSGVLKKTSERFTLPVSHRRLGRNGVSICREQVGDELGSFDRNGYIDLDPSRNLYTERGLGFCVTSRAVGLPLLAIGEGEISDRVVPSSRFRFGPAHGERYVVVEHEEGFTVYDQTEQFHRIGVSVDSGDVVAKLISNDSMYGPHTHIYYFAKTEDGEVGQHKVFGFRPFET
jgi:hypothetical protein